MTEMLDPVTRSHVEKAADALQDEFAGTFSRETIARYIAESVDLLGESKINVFVPVLRSRERLRALGQAEGIITKQQPEVLFVCIQNAGRSQMAAGRGAPIERARAHTVGGLGPRRARIRSPQKRWPSSESTWPTPFRSHLRMRSSERLTSS